MNEKKEVIFRAETLQTWFPITKGPFKKVVGHVKAVDGVDIEVYKGETLGIVGESGCGKSTLGKTLMMLEHATGGHVFFNYDNEFRDITAFNKKEMFDFRRKVQMVFQDPYSALNPQKKIYTSFEEPLKVHGMSLQEEREARMRQVLSMVNIQPDYLMRYPHEFSGGQRQRLCIARALEVLPEVLICDEPVSSLDYSIRKQILHLLNELQEKYEMTYLLITHDLSNVPYLCKEVAIMYQGRVVEFIDHTDSLKETAVHPYTKDLFDSIPVKEPKMRRIGLQEKKIFSDTIPEQGCPYQNRCRGCTNICREHIPELAEIETGHFAACHML